MSSGSYTIKQRWLDKIQRVDGQPNLQAIMIIAYLDRLWTSSTSESVEVAAAHVARATRLSLRSVTRQLHLLQAQNLVGLEDDAVLYAGDWRLAR